MLIPADKARVNKQCEIINKLGREEILSQLQEECSELAIAASKVRRVLAGTTPVTVEEALANLNEETGDVFLLLDMVTMAGYLNMQRAKESALYKIDRWYRRLTEDGGDSNA